MTDITPVYQVENIDKYKHLQEVDSPLYANQEISKGWKLLGLFPNHKTDDKADYPVIYVLGK